MYIYIYKYFRYEIHSYFIDAANFYFIQVPMILKFPERKKQKRKNKIT